MSEEGTATVIELLLREPEVVAWLDDYRPAEPEEAADAGGDPPDAA